MTLSEQEIIMLQPFSSKIGRIEQVFSLKDKSAISGNSFRIFASGKNYKLRYFDEESKAVRIQNNVLMLPKYFPPFFGREGHFLLFDWRNGDYLKNHTVQDCYFIGKMMGEAHALGAIKENANVDNNFESYLKKLKLVFSVEIIEEVVKKYFKLKEKLKVDIVLEFNDVHQKNFIKESDGTIYYIDEEDFDYKIKGIGFAKPLLTSQWMKTQEEKDAFWKGYNEHHSSDYFDKDYAQFIYFLQLIRTIATRTETGADYSAEKQALLNII